MWYVLLINRTHGDDLDHDVVLPSHDHPFEYYTNSQTCTPKKFLLLYNSFITRMISHGPLRCTPAKRNIASERCVERRYKYNIETLRFLRRDIVRGKRVKNLTARVWISGLIKGVDFRKRGVVLSTPTFAVPKFCNWIRPKHFHRTT